MKSIAGLVILLHLMLLFGSIALSIYGLVLAFSASVVLGFIVMLIEPSPLILGLIAICGHADVAQRLAAWLGLS